MTSLRGLTILPTAPVETTWAVPDRPSAPTPRPGEPFEGEVACLCGSCRRVVLPNTAAHPVWRCLDCGFLSNLRPHLRRRR